MLKENSSEEITSLMSLILLNKFGLENQTTITREKLKDPWELLPAKSTQLPSQSEKLSNINSDLKIKSEMQSMPSLIFQKDLPETPKQEKSQA